MTVDSVNSVARSSPPTDSGAMCSTVRVDDSDRPVRSSATQTTSRRFAGSGSSKAPSTRTAVSWSSSKEVSAADRAAPWPSSAPPGPRAGPMAERASHNRSRSVARTSAASAGMAVHSRLGASSSMSPSCSPAPISASTVSSSMSLPQRRAATVIEAAERSDVDTEVMRSTRSCASSTITTWWSGSTLAGLIASIANSA